jgi:3-dehydroquinate dehydratase II
MSSQQTVDRQPILLLSGPNLNLLGSREPQIYGTATLADHLDTARTVAEAGGYAIEHLQANSEGPLVDAVHQARNRCSAIIVNAGALTHYSWALHDALSAFDGVKVELHLSNTHARDTWRHLSVIAPAVNGSIQGFGGDGYRLAMLGVIALLSKR